MADPLLKHRCGAFGRCRQRAWRDGECRYHAYAAAMPGFRHDPYYHEKIMSGLLRPTWGYFTPLQLHAMFDRYRKDDGRKSDEYRDFDPESPKRRRRWLTFWRTSGDR